MDTDTLKNESQHSDIQGLVSQARAAYQQNRIKECLALTKALQLVDPGNAVAAELQNAVRSDMQRDLSDARGLLEESRNKPEGQKYRKAAEIILLKALYLDPENEAAKTLLSSVRSSSEGHAVPSAVPSPGPEPLAAAASAATIAHTAPIDAAVFENVTRPEPPRPEPVGFTTGVTPAEKLEKKKRSAVTAPLVVVTILVLGGGAFMARQWLGAQNVAAASAPPHSANQSRALPTSDPLAAAVQLSADAQAKPAPTPQGTPALSASTPSDPAPAAPPRAVAETGSLAVSSVIPAEIYLGDKYLGSTPTTLQLPSGNQTVEYRHGDLRSVVTHVVKPNETISARITFDVLVQVNAKPWAQVYIDGTARLPLGQTPLSDVRVPIGSVLVFENPNFPSKSHTIALNDKTVQMVFQ